MLSSLKVVTGFRNSVFLKTKTVFAIIVKISTLFTVCFSTSISKRIEEKHIIYIMSRIINFTVMIFFISFGYIQVKQETQVENKLYVFIPFFVIKRQQFTNLCPSLDRISKDIVKTRDEQPPKPAADTAAAETLAEAVSVTKPEEKEPERKAKLKIYSPLRADKPRVI